MHRDVRYVPKQQQGLGDKSAKGLNKGIIYLAFLPASIMGTIGLFLVAITQQSGLISRNFSMNKGILLLPVAALSIRFRDAE